MNKKRLLASLSLSLVSLLAGCSYGGSAVFSHEKFVSFFEEEELDTQKTRVFDLGDNITINRSEIDDDQNVTTESFTLSSGSIDRWVSEKKGSALSFAYQNEIKDADKVQTLKNRYSSSLAYSSTVIPDEEDPETINTTETYTYKNDIDFVDGSEEDYDECEKFTNLMSYSTLSISEDLGQTVETTVKTWSESYDLFSVSKDFDNETNVTTTTKIDENYSFVFVESETDSTILRTLTYSISTVLTVSEEVLDEVGDIVSGSKLINTASETTTVNAALEIEEGVKKNKVSIYEWNGSEYIKDNEQSYEDPDDNDFRFEVEPTYLENFSANEMFMTFTGLGLLEDFLDYLTIFYNNLFIEFETYLNGSEENEEIVKEGLVYQYRSLLSSNLNSYEIMQYTFVKPSDDEKPAYLSDASYLVFDSVTDSSVTLSRVSIVY